MKYNSLLITGGAGFVGANLAVMFKKKYPQLEVIALDNLKRRGSEINISRLREENIRFVHGDIRNPEDLVLDTKVELLIECSAEPSVLAGFGDNPDYIINTNFSGTVNCLELARKHNADIIFLSTSRVYSCEAVNNIETQELESRFEWISGQKIPGWSTAGIDTGFSTLSAKTLYGATKLCSEIIMQEYLNMYNIKGVINRCGVIAGPGQFGKVDQGVFTFWMLAHYFRRELKYIGFGGKGKQVRDLLHVDDLFELIDLQVSCLDKINAGIYNVGGGREISLSLLELTKLCRQISGNKINIGSDQNNRPGDIIIYLTDNQKVNQDLGWSPKKTALDILGDIYNWIHENQNKLKTIY